MYHPVPLNLVGLTLAITILKTVYAVQILSPVVDEIQSGNVSAHLGKTASLRCRVLNKSNYTVSWIRHRDLHLLTVDQYTYTTDQRFRAIYEASTGDWVLFISSLQSRDGGLYECQIGTTPPMGHFVYLDIREPSTTILGGNDLHVNLGSSLNLTCVVLYNRSPPDVTWFHGDQVVEYTSVRGGITVVTESGESTRSSLLINHARKSDEGNYTCFPEGTLPSSTYVHVLTEENRAAMYSKASYLSADCRGSLLPMILLIRLLMMHTARKG